MPGQGFHCTHFLCEKCQTYPIHFFFKSCILSSQVRVMCPSNVQLPPLTNATQLLQDALHERGCDVNFLPPPSSTPNTCLPKEKVISNCSQLQPVADHHAAASQRACTAYTSPFHADGEVFGNMFCYLCNGGREEDLSGGRPCLDGGQTFVATASSLLTFMQRPREVQRPVTSSCQPDAVYDPSEVSDLSVSTTWNNYSPAVEH